LTLSANSVLTLYFGTEKAEVNCQNCYNKRQRFWLLKKEQPGHLIPSTC